MSIRSGSFSGRAANPKRPNLEPDSRVRWNAEIIQQKFLYEKSGTSSWGITDADQLLDTINTFTASLPFIVNTRAIQAGNEVILKWVPPPNPRNFNWFPIEVGQITMEDNSKRQRTD